MYDTTRIERALDVLQFAPFTLLGCVRRNMWNVQWRSDVGAAVCLLVGRKHRLTWPGGEVDVVRTADGVLVQWHPGPWRDWWLDDAILFAGMVRATSAGSVPGVLVLHEVDGQTRVRYIEAPDTCTETYEATLRAWREGGTARPPRLDRRSERAEQTCYRCPVRRRCEAVDLEAGQMDDWF
jgi:hypothetical protein